jgi:hypothetical protein
VTVYTVAGRRLVVHDREEWQNPARPVTGPTPYPDLVHHFVVHWPGAPATWKPPTDTAAHLRSAQDSYLNDPNRRYSYGYGHVIGVNPIDWDADPIATDIWQVRGFDIRIASNDGDLGEYGRMSNPNFNGRSTSAQFMASVAHPPTPDQVQQMRYLVAIADQVYRETLAVIPHRTSDSTTCPGDTITALIPTIAKRPEPPPPPPPSTGGHVLLYRVVPDDSYYAICRKVYADGRATAERVAAIQQANGNAALRPGDLVNIPGRL